MSFGHYSNDCGNYHSLVRDFSGFRPKFVVLCGSSRFQEEIHAENKDLTLAGNIVLSLGVFGANDADKEKLDRLHKQKIELADEVRIVNVEGYVGESTLSEIQYAELLGKPITYVEK